MTDDEKKIVVRLMQTVWQRIGYDCLEAYGSDKSMRRSEVVEVVLDADRPESEARSDEQRAALKRFRALSRRAQDKVMREAFPHEGYCI